MNTSEWLDVPVGADAHRWVTRRGCRTVLAVGHTVTSCERLFEAVELLETDQRVQVVFTQAPDVFGNGVADFLRSAGGVVLPWDQAVRERFDLALATAYGSLHRLHAPVAVMPHGAGFAKGHRSSTGAFEVYGLDRQRLLHNGKPIARLVVLSHHSQLDVLRAQCPEAVDVAEVVGDLCYDRLVASIPHRDDYRAALGVRDDQELVVVTSTWGSGSLFGEHLDLLPRLLDELPGNFHVAALAHPAVWFGHGPRQVKAWLADCVDAGLLLFSPELDWRAALVAADHVIGDHGSTVAYAAAIGRPVSLVDRPPQLTVLGTSVQADLGRRAQRIRPDLPLPQQLAAARQAVDGLGTDIRDRLTSRPGLAASSLRRSLYRLLGLSEPGSHRALAAVPTPRQWSHP